MERSGRNFSSSLTERESLPRLKIQSLDSLDAYEGVATADGIRFTRNGKTESIHAGNGEDTGMKWLLDKKNCLIINYGEGFCRD